MSDVKRRIFGWIHDPIPAWVFTVAFITALLGGTGFGFVASYAAGNYDGPPPVGASRTAPTDDTLQPGDKMPDQPEPEPNYAIPAPEDFDLAVKITEKECYGYGVGCNVAYRIEVGYSGDPYDPDVEWEVTYKVTGGENGPQVNTFTVIGDEYEVPFEQFAMTSSRGSNLKAKATSVTRIS